MYSSRPISGSRPTPSPGLRRALIIRFAALTAHALNPPEGDATLEDYDLYLFLVDTLAGQRGPQSARYLETLAGHALTEGRISPEQAAQTYFERVIDRPLHLARANLCHKGHELLLALCRRGADRRWAGARLVRSDAVDVSAAPADASAAATPGAPADFAATAARLACAPCGLSPGNPAAATRARAGPLALESGGARAEVPEELSLWRAMLAAPRPLRPVAGEAWLEFRNTVIQAFEAANAPYATLLSLGLWPADWDGALSAHAARQLSVFLAALREADGLASLPEWRKAWAEKRRVPGYGSADDLWRSPLGARLRSPVRERTVALAAPPPEAAEPEARSAEPPAQDEDGAAEERMLEPADFERLLGKCREGGCIDDLEAWLFIRLRQGESAARLAKNAAVRSRLAERSLTMAAWLDDVGRRVHAYVSGLMADPSR